MTIKHFLTTLFLLASFYSSAQKLASIKGRVLKKVDSLPVYNAHIYIEGKSIGTTSNENGAFEFHFKEELKEKSITISSIGFVTQQLFFTNTNNQPLVICLEEDLLILKAVTVTSIEPTQILLNVVNNIKSNYPQAKFKKEIYYKEAFSVNDTPIRYLEIVADLVGEGFSNKKQNPYKYELFIKEKRPGFNIDTTFEGGNGIGVLHFLTGSKRYLKKSNFKDYDIELVGYSTYHNHEVFKLLIKLKRANPTIATLYITTDSFALVAINRLYINEDRTVPTNMFYFTKWYEYVDFIQLKDGYWYINSINDFRESINVEGNITQMKRVVRLTKLNDKDGFSKKNRITRETDLYKYRVPYNSVFWQNYNAPLETEEEKRVKKELK